VKKAILAALILLVSNDAVAAEKLSCVVSNFRPGDTLNFMNERLNTFKGKVEPGEFLVVDAIGNTFLKNQLHRDEASKLDIFTAGKILNFVVVVNQKTGASAIGEKVAILTDLQKGLAVTCGIENDAQ